MSVACLLPPTWKRSQLDRTTLKRLTDRLTNDCRYYQFAEASTGDVIFSEQFRGAVMHYCVDDVNVTGALSACTRLLYLSEFFILIPAKTHLS